MPDGFAIRRDVSREIIVATVSPEATGAQRRYFQRIAKFNIRGFKEDDVREAFAAIQLRDRVSVVPVKIEECA